MLQANRLGRRRNQVIAPYALNLPDEVLHAVSLQALVADRLHGTAFRIIDDSA
jgi:hypothetical protein